MRFLMVPARHQPIIEPKVKDRGWFNDQSMSSFHTIEDKKVCVIPLAENAPTNLGSEFEGLEIIEHDSDYGKMLDEEERKFQERKRLAANERAEREVRERQAEEERRASVLREKIRMRENTPVSQRIYQIEEKLDNMEKQISELSEIMQNVIAGVNNLHDNTKESFNQVSKHINRQSKFDTNFRLYWSPRKGHEWKKRII